MTFFNILFLKIILYSSFLVFDFITYAQKQYFKKYFSSSLEMNEYLSTVVNSNDSFLDFTAA